MSQSVKHGKKRALSDAISDPAFPKAKKQKESANENESTSSNKNQKHEDIDIKSDDDDYDSSSISDTAEISFQHNRFAFSNVSSKKTNRLLKECLDLRKATAKYVVSKDTKSVTFYPSESVGVQASIQPLPTETFTISTRFRKIMRYLKCNTLEHIYDDKIDIVQTETYLNSFAAAAEYAFYQHYPLSIKPSDIWILILQATALHVSQNAEKLRNKFVNHEGKKNLEIVRDSFVKGGKNNDWDGVVNEFMQQIDKNSVKDIVSLFEPDFTTATLMDRLAARVSTMDIMKEYFSYSMRCGCGFPQITLDGTKEDWIKLKNKTKILLNTKVVPEFGKKWGAALFPVLQRFINAYDGKIDCLFWNSMVRRGAIGPSGIRMMPGIGSLKGYYCGWMNVFFPYSERKKEGAVRRASRGKTRNSNELEKKRENVSSDISWNKYCVAYSKKASYIMKGISSCCTNGMYFENFPVGVGSAPVVYKDLTTGSQYDLKFVSGFLGMQQDPKTLELSCKIGWFVAEK